MSEVIKEMDSNRASQPSEVKVFSCSLKELLEVNFVVTKQERVLYIPEYQRPYVWQEKQINSLLSSIEEHNTSDMQGEKPNYYLGSIILHETETEYRIIDGQQRILTSLLLNRFLEKDQQVNTDLKITASKSIASIKRNFAYLGTIKDGKVFEFREYDFSAIKFDELNVTLVVTNSEDLAFKFFETNNTGGVRLSGTDIMKAHHLRAVKLTKEINYQAQKWESQNFEKIEAIAQMLTKIRYWDNRHWKQFPKRNAPPKIKQAIVDEFTLLTKGDKDVSYHHSAVVKKNGQTTQMHESPYKMIKQPLANGTNTLDYINDYVSLYIDLFEEYKNYELSDEFIYFNKQMLTGEYSNHLPKLLTQIAIVAYVSRFGFNRLYEASLLIFRAVYSLRLKQSKIVESSISKFVFDNQFIDNILEVFTVDELFLYLKKYTFNLDSNAIENAKGKLLSKGNFMRSLNSYFGEEIKLPEGYKKLGKEESIATDLLKAIENKIKEIKKKDDK